MSVQTEAGWSAPFVFWILSYRVQRSLTVPTVPLWHMQDEGVINGTQILWISGDDMQVPLPRTEGNRDIDHVGMARPAAQQADSAGDRVVQGDDLRALVTE